MLSPQGLGAPADLPVLLKSPQPATSVTNANTSKPRQQSLELKSPQQDELLLMAPASRQDLLAKEHFAFVFDKAKTQNYNDPAAKGPGSHT